MKTKVFVTLAIIIFSLTGTLAQDATEIVKKANDKMQGEITSQSVMTMTIVRPTWERKISFKSWTKGRDYSLALITSPPKEQGQTFLKRGNEMWSWSPIINRLIKLPPSMMSQGWMGSDFSNDDLLKESSIVVDYTHKIIGDTTIEGRDCYQIELIPLENAAVVWGKIIMNISKKEFLEMKNTYYDEDGYLVKTETASDIKMMDGRLIPSKFELVPADKPGNKTMIKMDEIQFNKPIPDAFFSQQNMKRIR